MKKIGFVGLGNMGKGMATNLQKSGFQVLAYDVDTDKLKELKKEGIQACESAQEVTKEVDEAILTMVVNQEQTEDVIFGEKGVASAERKDITVVVMSTLNPTVIEDIEKKANEYDINIFDAPVSGSLSGAENGTLAIFASGKKSLNDTLKPYFEALGENVFELGEEIGAGQAAKLSNNLLLGIHMAGMSEAIRFAQNYDIKEDELLDIVKVSTGDSWVANNWEEVKEFNNNGTVDVIYKDLTSVMTEATQHKIFIPVSGLVLNELHNAMDKQD